MILNFFMTINFDAKLDEIFENSKRDKGKNFFYKGWSFIKIQGLFCIVVSYTELHRGDAELHREIFSAFLCVYFVFLCVTYRKKRKKKHIKSLTMQER